MGYRHGTRMPTGKIVYLELQRFSDDRNVDVLKVWVTGYSGSGRCYTVRVVTSATGIGGRLSRIPFDSVQFGVGLVAGPSATRFIRRPRWTEREFRTRASTLALGGL